MSCSNHHSHSGVNMTQHPSAAKPESPNRAMALARGVPVRLPAKLFQAAELTNPLSLSRLATDEGNNYE
jgi:hypothetical protein